MQGQTDACDWVDDVEQLGDQTMGDLPLTLAAFRRPISFSTDQEPIRCSANRHNLRWHIRRWQTQALWHYSRKRIISDRRTNFIGASREQHEAVQLENEGKLMEEFVSPDTKKTFNTPAATQFGGYLERMIQENDYYFLPTSVKWSFANDTGGNWGDSVLQTVHWHIAR